MASLYDTAKMIKRNAEKLGFDVHESMATTGTIYLRCAHGEHTCTVRVADHGECYCREDISVDPQGVKPWAAVGKLAELVGEKAPAWVTRERNRHEARLADNRRQLDARLDARFRREALTARFDDRREFLAEKGYL